MRDIVTFETPETLARAAAGMIVEKAREALSLRGRFSLVLSGGTTPAGVYRLLREEPFQSRIDWAGVHLFWGDERCVQPDHHESNYRTAQELFIGDVPIPPAHVHRMRGEFDPNEAAADYERVLADFFGGGEKGETLPVFDLVLLGLGADGHTASLFPGAAAGHEGALVAAVYVERLGSWRVSLTARAINASRQVLFLVTGHGKADAVRRSIQGPGLPRELPARSIRPGSGRLVWMLDEAAASRL